MTGTSSREKDTIRVAIECIDSVVTERDSLLLKLKDKKQIRIRIKDLEILKGYRVIMDKIISYQTH
jgi:hypothetical protein